MLTASRARVRAAAPDDANAHHAAARVRLSAHLAGVALVPTVAALADSGALRIIRQAAEVSADSLAARSAADPAMLHVALRLLTACGWLVEHASADQRDRFYQPTPAGRDACDMAPPLFRQATAGLSAIVDLPHAFSGEAGEGFVSALRELAGLGGSIDRRDGEAAQLVAGPLDGLTVVAAVVTLARAGILDLLAQGPLQLLEMDELLQVLLDRLVAEDWVVSATDLRLTPAGHEAAAMVPACSEVWAQLPMLLSAVSRVAPRANVLATVASGSPEETLYVAGRGSAFLLWSGALDELIIDLFNRPLPQQPRGICDVSCASGALLAHAYRVIRERTARGRLLKEQPLLVLGADESRLARDTTMRALRAANIPRFHVVAAGPGDPSSIAEEGARHHIPLRDLLHLQVLTGVSGADAHGEDPIGATARRLTRWLPYAARFGMAVLERHPLASGAAAPDMTAAAAYDAVLGYAGRPHCSAESLIEAARRAGLDRHPRFRAQFPGSAAPVVSFGYFTVAGRTHA